MTDKICVVIGGGGFVGRHLLRRLLQDGGWRIRIVDLPQELRFTDTPIDEEICHSLEAGRAHYISANVCNIVAVQEVCKGAEVVFHMASPDPNNPNQDLHVAVNVTGTQNVIAACLKEGVKKLIYTSSASVVFDGVNPVVNGDESLPYPAIPMNAYNATKAQAEKLVLEANGKSKLQTIALRPSGVFGPGDPVFLPLLVKNANAGKLKFVIGNGTNMFDFTYVENVIHAHILAEEALEHNKGRTEEDPAGKAFFVTNGEPRLFWSFVSNILEALGYSPPSKNLPAGMLLPLAYVVHGIGSFLAPLGVPLSDFSPARIRLVTVPRTFSCARAAKLLGYAPPVPLQEGVRRTVESSQYLRREVLGAKRGPSKAHRFLGSGQTADVLLWRDVKQSLLFFVGFFLVYYLFFSSGLTLIALIANILLILTVTLFVYNNFLPFLSSFGFPLPEMSSEWKIPEEYTEVIARHVSQKWNGFILTYLRPLIVDRNVFFFFKVVFALYVIRWISSFFSTSTLIATILFGGFALPLLYDMNEGKVDALAVQAGSKLTEVGGQFRERAVAIHAQIGSRLPKSLQKQVSKQD